MCSRVCVELGKWLCACRRKQRHTLVCDHWKGKSNIDMELAGSKELLFPCCSIPIIASERSLQTETQDSQSHAHINMVKHNCGCENPRCLSPPQTLLSVAPKTHCPRSLRNRRQFQSSGLRNGCFFLRHQRGCIKTYFEQRQVCFMDLLLAICF